MKPTRQGCFQSPILGGAVDPSPNRLRGLTAEREDIAPYDSSNVLMPSTRHAYPQVVSRVLASFTEGISSFSAGQCDLSTGFDSRQLHETDRS